MPREHTSHSKHPLPTREDSTWTLPQDQYQNQIDYILYSQGCIFFAAKDGEALYSQQKQDQELTVAQLMKSLRQIQT